MSNQTPARCDAVVGQHLHVELDVLADLAQGRILQQAAQTVQYGGAGELAGGKRFLPLQRLPAGEGRRKVFPHPAGRGAGEMSHVPPEYNRPHDPGTRTKARQSLPGAGRGWWSPGRRQTHRPAPVPLPSASSSSAVVTV